MGLLFENYEDKEFILLATENIGMSLSKGAQNLLLKKIEDANSLIIEGNEEYLDKLSFYNAESVEVIASLYLSDKKTEFVDRGVVGMFPSKETRDKYGLSEEVLEKMFSLHLVLKYNINDPDLSDEFKFAITQIHVENGVINPYAVIDKVKSNVKLFKNMPQYTLKQMFLATEDFEKNIMNILNYEEWTRKVEQKIVEVEKPNACVLSSESFSLFKKTFGKQLKFRTIDQLKEEYEILDKYLKLD